MKPMHNHRLEGVYLNQRPVLCAWQVAGVVILMACIFLAFPTPVHAATGLPTSHLGALLPTSALLAGLSLIAFAAMVRDTRPSASQPSNTDTGFGAEGSQINKMLVGVLLVDFSGRILDINEIAATWANTPRKGLLGKPIVEYNHALGRILLEARRGVTLDQEITLENATPPRQCHLRLVETTTAAGHSARLLTLEDFTRYVRGQQELKRDRLLLEAALQGQHSGLMVTDPAGRVVLRTENLIKTFNLPERAFDTGLLGWRNQMAQEMKDPERFHNFLDMTIAQPSGETMEMLEMANGRWLECRSHTFTPTGSEILYRIWSFTDFTEQTKREQELEHLSTHDSLTGAFNRAFFENQLRRFRLTTQRYPVSLIVSDVDRLKAVNDQYGHPTGDEVLRQVVGILNNACRSDDIVARIGGDEFCILLAHADASAAEQIIERVHTLENLHNLQHPIPGISLSLGYAVAANPAEMETIFQRADSSMYTTRYRKRGDNKKTDS